MYISYITWLICITDGLIYTIDISDILVIIFGSKNVDKFRSLSRVINYESFYIFANKF